MILSGYIQIWHFYRTLCRRYFFPGHSVYIGLRIIYHQKNYRIVFYCIKRSVCCMHSRSSERNRHVSIRHLWFAI